MDRFIVYVDDAAHAQQALAALQEGRGSAAAQWVLVACAPRMTHRVSKWVSHSSRENWRTRWADKLFSQILNAVPLAHATVTTIVAKGPLAELTDQLLASARPAEHVQVLDARRPKAPTEPEVPATAVSASPHASLVTRLSGVLAGVGTACMLALE